jgi:hypothetical protein
VRRRRELEELRQGSLDRFLETNARSTEAAIEQRLMAEYVFDGGAANFPKE